MGPKSWFAGVVACGAASRCFSVPTATIVMGGSFRRLAAGAAVGSGAVADVAAAGASAVVLESVETAPSWRNRRQPTRETALMSTGLPQ